MNNINLDIVSSLPSLYSMQDFEEKAIQETIEELKAMRNLDKTNFSDGYERGRAEVIDEIKERFKPCYDCDYCLDEHKKYFEKQCEKATRIHYTKLCEYLELLKAGGME